MKRQFLMIAARILITTLFASSLYTAGASAQERLFGANEAWNAAYQALRPQDGNELAMFRPESSLPSILDVALAESAYARDQSPLVRAICQRAAWRAFDSLAAETDYVDGANQALRLRLRLAKIISVTALTRDEIAGLPNTYTGTAIGDDGKRNPVFDLALPGDLFDKDGSWLQLTHKRLGRIGLTHEKSRQGRSEFLLFVRFPEGRRQGEEFLKRHNASAEGQAQRRLEILDFRVPRTSTVSDTPPLPKGTRAILVERMLVVTTDDIPAATAIATSVAMIDQTPTVDKKSDRLFGVRSAAFEIDFGSLLDAQKNVSLRRLGEHEPFSGEQRFPNGIQICAICHSGNGLMSLSGGVAGMVVPDSRTVDVVPNGSASATATWKRQDFSFGLLRGTFEGLHGFDATENGRTNRCTGAADIAFSNGRSTSAARLSPSLSGTSRTPHASSLVWRFPDILAWVFRQTGSTFILGVRPRNVRC
jgi:hypothetical protein